jgi:hypothetical protein
MARLPRQRLRRPRPHLFLEILEDRVALSSTNATTIPTVLFQPPSLSPQAVIAPAASQSWASQYTQVLTAQTPQNQPAQWPSSSAADSAWSAGTAASPNDDLPYQTYSSASTSGTATNGSQAAGASASGNKGGAVPSPTSPNTEEYGTQSTGSVQSSTPQTANQTPGSGTAYNTQQASGQPSADTSPDTTAAYYYCSPQMYIDMATYQETVAANARNAAETAVVRVLMEPAPSKEQPSLGKPAVPQAAAAGDAQDVLSQAPENTAAPKPSDRSGDAPGVVGHRAPDVQADWLAMLDSAPLEKTRAQGETDQESGESAAPPSTLSEEMPPSPGTLLAGALPFDMEALERSVGRFFAQVDQTSSEAGWQRPQTLALWLGAAATATAAFEWTRRRVLTPPLMAGANAEGDHTWANDPDLALLPMGDEA